MSKLAYVALVCVISMICATILDSVEMLKWCVGGSFVLVLGSLVIDAFSRRIE